MDENISILIQKIKFIINVFASQNQTKVLFVESTFFDTEKCLVQNILATSEWNKVMHVQRGRQTMFLKM